MSGDRSVFPGFEAMAEDPAELIGRLVELRRAKGLSQTEVADRMGTSQPALARLESGRSDARLSTIARYARAVEADVGYLVRSSPEPGERS